MNNFQEVTTEQGRADGEEAWLRRIEPGKCWISVIYRRTGFGWYEWETALVFMLESCEREKRWESDDRDCLIIAGDRREELNDMPREQLRDWYAANIGGNRNSMETLLRMVQAAIT